MSHFIAALVLCLALASAAPAFAQETPAQDAYSGEAGQHVTDPTASGSLPFTGLNLTLAVVVGAGLLGTGLMLRRSTQKAE